MNRIIFTFCLSFLVLSNLNAQIFINEFMADNDAIIMDESGAYEDWIEVYNSGNSVVDIGGYFVSDDNSNFFKFQIPTGDTATIIQPGGFLILWADDDVSDGALHLGIKLSKDGERIILSAADSSMVDSISFGAQTTDISYGRVTDGASNWTSFAIPTPNASNQSVSIADINVASTIQMYPNPNNGDKVYFSQNADIEIFDLNGKRIKTANNTNEISIADLKSGVYYIRFNGQFVQKLMVK
ncbi:MAG: lamin tail domain-containing protein [Bacteroidales bacterium]|nr:lamin tail domain-containing protein [Bacteroidales bacterium]